MSEPAPAAHALTLRVYYEDTDMAGVVYYANYLKYLERGRSEMVRAAGLDQGALRAAGQVFVVRRIAADYLRPARFDDTLTVTTALRRMGGASFDLHQAVLRGPETLLTAEVRVAFMTIAGRPARLPPALRAALTPG
ncbi:MAG: tol-pal system-associated acyl-CoA thioesterase [Pseudomonadota bacterium]